MPRAQLAKRPDVRAEQRRIISNTIILVIILILILILIIRQRYCGPRRAHVAAERRDVLARHAVPAGTGS